MGLEKKGTALEDLNLNEMEIKDIKSVEEELVLYGLLKEEVELTFEEIVLRTGLQESKVSKILDRLLKKKIIRKSKYMTTKYRLS